MTRVSAPARFTRKPRSVSEVSIPLDEAQSVDLEALLAKWQRILRLQDWDVKINLVAKKSASIRILFPVEFDATIKWPQDIEKTIVHELVHLHFAPIDDFDGLKGRLMEQAVECIASGLVERDRASQ